MENAANESAGCAGPLHIHALPDDLLLRILTQPVFLCDERFNSLPLVCKRWAEVAPKAVEAAEGNASGPHCHARLLSLHSWLAKHAAAGSLRQLRLNVRSPDGVLEEQEALALLRHSVLPACSRLHKLRLLVGNFRTPFGLEGWAANLHHLRCLTVCALGDMPVTTQQLRGLTRLQELRLEGGSLTFSEGAELPPSLTWLTLFRLQDDHLPPLLAALTSLQVLDLNFLPMAAGGYDGLTALTWLKRMRLSFTYLPACLSALTQLSVLSLVNTPANHSSPAATAEAQEEAVGALPNLVHLTLFARSREETNRVARLPTTLAALSRLQSLVWHAPPAHNPALPPGPYLASLTRLALHPPAVVANLQQLSQQAGQLAQLTLLHDDWERPGDAEARVAVASWAGGHAPLQRLLMDRAPRTPALMTACQLAQQRKPGLRVEVSASNFHQQL